MDATTLENAWITGFIKAGAGLAPGIPDIKAPNLSKFEIAKPNLINSATSHVNNAISSIAGQANYNAYQNFNNKTLPAIQNRFSNILASKSNNQYLPQVNQKLINSDNTTVQQLDSLIPTASSYYGKYKPWIDDYNQLSSDATEAKHAVLPFTQPVDTAMSDVGSFENKQLMNSFPEIKNLQSAGDKYTNYEQTPFWQRLTGMHNNRPDLSLDENNQVKDVLNLPGVNQAVIDGIKNNPGQAAKAVTNPVTAGLGLGEAGGLSSRVGRSALLRSMPSVGRTLGIGSNILRSGGGALAAAGLVGNSMAEMPGMGRYIGNEIGNGVPASQATLDYFKQPMQTADHVHSLSSYLQNYADSIVHPVRTIGGAAVGLGQLGSLGYDNLQQHLMNVKDSPIPQNQNLRGAMND